MIHPPVQASRASECAAKTRGDVRLSSQTNASTFGSGPQLGMSYLSRVRRTACTYEGILSPMLGASRRVPVESTDGSLTSNLNTALDPFADQANGAARPNQRRRT